jgi:hypothetical protein
MKTATVKTKGAKVNEAFAEVARKTRNFVKNLRRDVVKFGNIQNDLTVSKYARRMALAEKVATQSVVTSIENILETSKSEDVNTTNENITNGIDNLVSELETKLANLTATKNDKEASKYKRRRARGEETATSRVLARVQKLQ